MLDQRTSEIGAFHLVAALSTIRSLKLPKLNTRVRFPSSAPINAADFRNELDAADAGNGVDVRHVRATPVNGSSPGMS